MCLLGHLVLCDDIFLIIFYSIICSEKGKRDKPSNVVRHRRIRIKTTFVYVVYFTFFYISGWFPTKSFKHLKDDYVFRTHCTAQPSNSSTPTVAVPSASPNFVRSWPKPVSIKVSLSPSKAPTLSSYISAKTRNVWLLTRNSLNFCMISMTNMRKLLSKPKTMTDLDSSHPKISSILWSISKAIFSPNQSKPIWCQLVKTTKSHIHFLSPSYHFCPILNWLKRSTWMLPTDQEPWK